MIAPEHLFVKFQEYVEDTLICFVPNFTVAEKRVLLSLHLYLASFKKYNIIIYYYYYYTVDIGMKNFSSEVQKASLFNLLILKHQCTIIKKMTIIILQKWVVCRQVSH